MRMYLPNNLLYLQNRAKKKRKMWLFLMEKYICGLLKMNAYFHRRSTNSKLHKQTHIHKTRESTECDISWGFLFWLGAVTNVRAVF